MFFPEIGVTEDKSNEKCQGKIDRIIKKYEHILNKTVQNLTREKQTQETYDEDIGPGKHFYNDIQFSHFCIDCFYISLSF